MSSIADLVPDPHRWRVVQLIDIGHKHIPELRIGQFIDNAMILFRERNNGAGPDLFNASDDYLADALANYLRTFRH